MDNIHYLISEYLRLNAYKIDGHALRSRTMSDPGNGVLTITNTLDYFDIEHVVVNVPHGALSELPEYFICQLSNGEINALALVQKEHDHYNISITDTKKFTFTHKEFLVEWTGFVIAIEKNTTAWYKQQPKKASAVIVLVLAAAMVLSSAALSTTVYNTAYLLLGLTGLLLSYLTFEQKIGKDSVASKLCTLSSSTDCDAVLRSKQARLFNLVDLSDLSIIYFSFLTLAVIYAPSHQLFLWLSALALPMTVYSWYSQYFQLKKWCPLCLGISAVLISQFVLVWTGSTPSEFDYRALLPFGFMFSLASLGWFKTKSLIIGIQERDLLEIENLTFRRNHDLFISYYHSLKKVNSGLESLKKIRLGSPNPALSLTVVINPLCHGCIEAFQAYRSLLAKHSDQISLEFLFLISPNTPKDHSKLQVSLRLLQLYFENDLDTFNTAQNEWYKTGNSVAWLAKWAAPDNDAYKSILQQQVRWCMQNDIDSTPTLLINGRVLPATYKTSDIENFIAPLLDLHKEIKTSGEDIMHDKTEPLTVSK